MTKWAPKSGARQAEYANIGPNTIRLIGPDGKLDSIPSGSRVIRSDWYNRYVPNHLRLVRYVRSESPATARPAKRSQLASPRRERLRQRIQDARQKVRTGQIQPVLPRRPKSLSKKAAPPLKVQPQQPVEGRKIVGKSIPNAAEVYRAAKTGNQIQVSNNIGVGILSYNRIGSLKRLVASIRAHTDLSRTTVFISDESTNLSADDIAWLDGLSDFVVLRGQPRLGIAGNSNRLLRCLARFKYKLLLNDDVEILKRGWDSFYPEAIKQTEIHHFCYREPGVYGAQSGVPKTVNGRQVSVVNDKPHGAVLALDDFAFAHVGFFDEGFGLYGMEHVDWSERVASATGHNGFYDAAESNQYFRIHAAASAVEDRTQHLHAAKERYAKVKGTRAYVKASDASAVPCISVIIPFRGQERVDDITTVVANIRGMKFPHVEMVVVEQDATQRLAPSALEPISYRFFAKQGHFNKSSAFNAGFRLSTCDYIVMHDADIVVKGSYLSDVAALLEFYDGCHIGAKVHYLNEEGTRRLNASGSLPDGNVTNVVGYFEGGSIACQRDVYRRVGGFDEAYDGYGCEDCCFFERLKKLSNFYDERSYDFFHLFHGRPSDSDARHAVNKAYHASVRRKYSLREYAETLSRKL
jgi:GT2 family glycosyltransferase